MTAEVLRRAVRGEGVGRRETAALLRGVGAGEVPLEVLASFLTALAIHGETTETLLGLVDAARESLVPVPCRARDAVDVCGTGGDGRGTANISTAAAFVVAGAGVPVAKHGNHGISSRSGSADVLGALGVEVRQPPEAVAAAIDEIGLGFIYAPLHHPLFARIGPLRRALGFRTAFNLLGPLCNPAGVKRQLLGVASPPAQRRIAEALAALGTERALVVRTEGPEGHYDEVTLTAPADAIRVERGRLMRLALGPREFGCDPVEPGDLAGGSPQDNAAQILAVLGGQPSGLRRVVCANAACALMVDGSSPEPRAAYRRAEAAIDGGAALAVLERLRAHTRAKEKGDGGETDTEDERDVMAG